MRLPLQTRGLRKLPGRPAAPGVRPIQEKEALT